MESEHYQNEVLPESTMLNHSICYDKDKFTACTWSQQPVLGDGCENLFLDVGSNIGIQPVFYVNQSYTNRGTYMIMYLIMNSGRTESKIERRSVYWHSSQTQLIDRDTRNWRQRTPDRGGDIVLSMLLSGVARGNPLEKTHLSFTAIIAMPIITGDFRSGR